MASQPSLFISHGAPDLVLQDIPASNFLRALGRHLPRPRAVVVASAHWTGAGIEVGGDPRPDTIHDFGGFAPELHRMRYPAPGDPALAARVVDALAAAGLPARTSARGLDHGVWVPLALLFPGAEVPVVPLSVQPGLDGAHHLAVGRALAGLRDEGVLVVGSGAATHNLGELMPGVEQAPSWVADFDDWAVARAGAGDGAALADWQRQGPQARRNHPTPEHWLPLLVAQGAGGGAPGRLLHRSTTWGVLRMTMLGFGGGLDAEVLP
ncbi:MAG: dioxygenase [Planctomycetes bacterium]|nr:dioxygenase [Planctomycetota bacterium]